MNTHNHTKQCFSLLDLPDEIKSNIIDHLDQRCAVLHLSRTCHAFEDLVLSRLYHDVDIEIPQSKAVGWDISRLPQFRPLVIDAIRRLTIRNGLMDVRDSFYGRKPTITQSVENYLCSLLRRIPEGHLQSFCFFHKLPLSLRTLDLLCSRHGERLRHLRYYELEMQSNPEVRLPNRLETIECRSIQTAEMLGKLFHFNRDTIQTLKLGQEKELMEQYRRTRIGFLDHMSQPLRALTIVLRLQDLPNLRHLALTGLNILFLVPTLTSQATFFCRLERLVLESCQGSTEFLECVANIFELFKPPSNILSLQTAPKLKQFLFRHEAPTNRLKERLINFLTSFGGLETLSLLFENATFLERPSALISTHGPTLKTLVMESRIQPRDHLGLDTSRPFGVGAYSSQLWEQSINDICRLCPHLQELGMGFCWTDEVVRLRKTRLPTLQNLKTIHIRNFPESQVLSQLGDYSIREHATKFIDWVYPSLVGGARPNLEILAIGPTLYESRWKSGGYGNSRNSSRSSSPNGTASNFNLAIAHNSTTPPSQYGFGHGYNSTPPSTTNSSANSSYSSSSSSSSTGAFSRQQAPEFLRTHWFCVDWAKTRFGRWSPLITSVSERYMEESRGERPLAGVFEQVWLK